MGQTQQLGLLYLCESEIVRFISSVKEEKVQLLPFTSTASLPLCSLGMSSCNWVNVHPWLWELFKRTFSLLKSISLTLFPPVLSPTESISHEDKWFACPSTSVFSLSSLSPCFSVSPSLFHVTPYLNHFSLHLLLTGTSYGTFRWSLKWTMSLANAASRTLKIHQLQPSHLHLMVHIISTQQLNRFTMKSYFLL